MKKMSILCSEYDIILGQKFFTKEIFVKKEEKAYQTKNRYERRTKKIKTAFQRMQKK